MAYSYSRHTVNASHDEFTFLFPFFCDDFTVRFSGWNIEVASNGNLRTRRPLAPISSVLNAFLQIISKLTTKLLSQSFFTTFTSRHVWRTEEVVWQVLVQKFLNAPKSLGGTAAMLIILIRQSYPGSHEFRGSPRTGVLKRGTPCLKQKFDQ